MKGMREEKEKSHRKSPRDLLTVRTVRISLKLPNLSSLKSVVYHKLLLAPNDELTRNLDLLFNLVSELHGI
ncbi:hypothetical protein ALC60_08806 [Trachymyrmex zeteki]|uniref:Uncharacterized protein n=1 Tax=Mycetomoellerius zeteki TaxID=64791 RepID=A0A151WWZ9_9HYME|nr:hypothetical protein ALC60_08806 [Trachymyrmex zeteki]